MRTDPRVSVIIPYFNQAKYLPEAIESLERQTLPSWEAIIVDDGSSSETKDFLDGLRADPRLLVLSQTNRGPAAARNAGLARARGEYIQFLDADDRLDPSKFDKQVRVLDRQPAAGVCYSGYRPFDSETGALLDPFSEVHFGPDALEDFLFRWDRGFNIPIHAALFRRGVLTSGGPPFDERLRGQEDWAMWVKLALRGATFLWTEGELALYRIHAASATRRHERSAGVFVRAAMVIQTLLPEELRSRFLEASGRQVESFEGVRTVALLKIQAETAERKLRDLSDAMGEAKRFNEEILAGRESAICELNEKLAAADRRVVELSDAMGEAKRFNEEILAGRESAICELNALLAAADRRVVELSDALGSAGRFKEDLLAERETTVRSLNERLAETDRRIVEMSEAMGAAKQYNDETVAERNATVANLCAKLAELERRAT